MRLGAGGERCHLLMPDMNPFDLALAAQRVGQPVETVADDAVNPFDSCGGENLGKLISNRFRHSYVPFFQ